MYLAKYLAHAGICSRRKAVELVKSGQIQVNGVAVKNPAHLVLPDDQVFYDGIPVNTETKSYVLLNKPKNCITTVSDEQERFCVGDIIKDITKHRLYPVGRLDRYTTGALLLTNDGQLTQQLLHPSYKITKVYVAILNKVFKLQSAKRMIAGLDLEDGLVHADAVEMGPDGKTVYITLHSGKNRVVRRMFLKLGYLVEKLNRMQFASLKVKGISRGAWRELDELEVAELRNEILGSGS
ncbi:rRNA pseudouridine synthase [bacterium]|nr:rRNA pseudouridine synthase [bacterium]MBT3903204.1 rRNA pseudouridine synthase [bacterium]MBT4577624.1 rRNA pseudouridine synthase [bacterium]MBT5345493.1 rRNA pseudouridine synthase [bacterium]MBT6131187.1 rRNA pseudouridine synthase [bacterium]